MLRQDNLTEELRKWRAARARKRSGLRPSEGRTVKVNGQEVLVVTKIRRAVA